MTNLIKSNSHFYALNFDTPGVGGIIQGGLHNVADSLSLRQDFSQVFGAQNISQSRGRQESR